VRTVADHLARLGAALIEPRRALRARLRGGAGGLADVLPWTLSAAAVARPTAFGQALSIARTDPLSGLLRVAGLWSELVAPILVAIIVLSVAAPWFRRDFDGGDVFEAGALALVPLVFVVGLGALLAAVGVPEAWLPVTAPRGPWLQHLVLSVLRYGGSGIVGVLLVVELTRSRPAAEDHVARTST